ncbi:glycerophosphodiester phosphodiesterase family protein [Vreelandella sp. EE7]
MFAFRIFILTSIFILTGCEGQASSESVARIAHAGGGYNNWAYTNSLEALDFNRDHFDLFEIDLLWTADDQLVCLHDWHYNAEWIFQRRFTSRPTLAEFEQLVDDNPYVQSCTLETLVQWLKENPDKRLVPDLKEDVVRGLALLAKQFDRVGEHVIAQIYTPDHYQQVRALGYSDVIWGLYQMFPIPPNDLLAMANSMELYGLAMPRRMAERGDGHALSEAGISTYVHTVNTQRELEYYQSLSIDEIYTDWLAP